MRPLLLSPLIKPSCPSRVFANTYPPPHLISPEALVIRRANHDGRDSTRK